MANYNIFTLIDDNTPWEKHLANMDFDFSYAEKNPAIRKVMRELPQGGKLVFLNNTLAKNNRLKIRVKDNYKSLVWLNPQNGAVVAQDVSQITLLPYQSLVLYVSTSSTSEINPTAFEIGKEMED